MINCLHIPRKYIKGKELIAKEKETGILIKVLL